jgi:peptidoglycan/xylan/chitin deacetylase (PgdA/CDA1 family)
MGICHAARGGLARKYARRYYYGVKRAINHWRNFLTDREPKFLILTYHRILPEAEFNPLNTIVPLKIFEKQIDLLAGRFPVISLSDAVSQKRSGRAKNNVQIVLTFDDGYIDNYETVFPLLSKKGLPAAFFVPTGYIGGKASLWDMEIIERLIASPEISQIKTSKHVFSKGAGETQPLFAFRVFEEMKSREISAIHEALDFLRRGPRGNDPKYGGCMDWSHIEEMSGAGMEIGAHGITHRSLAGIPLCEAAEEIKRSKSEIESRTNKECVHFSFPFGSGNDYNEALIDNVKDAGFQACLLNVHGYNRVKSDNFRLKRVIIEEASQLSFLLG